MRILQIASEMTCVAKVGGLGDVLMGLTRELKRKGHDVLAIIPSYGCIDWEYLTKSGRVDHFDTTVGGASRRGTLTYATLHNAIPVALLDTEDGFFSKKDSIYGRPDDAGYFLAFCRAICDWIRATNAQIDAVHTHDWPTSLFPQIYRTLFQADTPFRSVFTIHNFEYQGWCGFESFAQAGLEAKDYLHLVDQGGCANLLRGGIQCSTYVTTVSPTYAKEILSNAKDPVLHRILMEKAENFIGILNGVDYSFWNPVTDKYLYQEYDGSNIESVVQAKMANKGQLFSQLGLSFHEPKPLLTFVTRLVYQKGIDLIASILQKAHLLNVDCLVIGSVPDDATRERFVALDGFMRSTNSGAVVLKNDERMAHRAYAAADFILVPSLYEPCGLTQLIGLMYGTIPIVRKTGGLADTIVDVQASPHTGNGFTFSEANPDEFEQTVVRALSYCSSADRKMPLIARGMGQDFSWRIPREQYERFYESSYYPQIQTCPCACPRPCPKNLL